ncbi:MAG: adenosyl-hopene transferase HpnH, partial [Rhodospirillaceae bacterium]
ERAVDAIKEAVSRGFRVTVNCTLFDNAVPDRVAAFFDYVSELGVEGITVSPGYAYERAPVQDHFLGRRQTKDLFRDIFRMGKARAKKWRFNQSSLFLDFLAGNQEYKCMPWGNPTRNVFGWQKPCYLLGEGFVGSFRELMETTDWESYGTGNYEKCANCMAHCGYEPTSVVDTVNRPLKALRVFMRGVDTDGPMAPEIPLEGQRPAEYVFEKQVQDFVSQESPRGEESVPQAKAG